MKAFGLVFHRQGADSHKIWHHLITRRFTTAPNHPGDMPEGMLRAILKQAGVEPDVFLQKLRSKAKPHWVA
jgi:predicted RNA binding protein YcfA (HicA-like mRNA interferase family)